MHTRPVTISHPGSSCISYFKKCLVSPFSHDQLSPVDKYHRRTSQYRKRAIKSGKRAAHRQGPSLTVSFYVIGRTYARASRRSRLCIHVVRIPIILRGAWVLRGLCVAPVDTFHASWARWGARVARLSLLPLSTPSTAAY